MPLDRNKPKRVVRKFNALWPIIQQIIGLPDDQAALKLVGASMRRMRDARRQMEKRSGPVYELAKYRSGVISDAYRAAGSPPKPPGSSFQPSASGALERMDTLEWQRWRAWLRRRTELQRELGMQRWKLREVDKHGN